MKLWKLKVAAVVLLVRCAAEMVPELLPPNVDAACDRAIECGAVSDDHPACVACLDQRASYINADDVPRLDSIECEAITAMAKRIRLPECVDGRWFGPSREQATAPIRIDN